MPDYTGIEIHVPDLPEAVPVGDWWRFAWTITVPLDSDADLHLPAPYGEMREITGIVGLIRRGQAFLLEVLSPTNVIDADVYAYASLVAWHIREAFGDQTAIDGVADHPMFKLVKGG